jgi:hypothetical protein
VLPSRLALNSPEGSLSESMESQLHDALVRLAVSQSIVRPNRNASHFHLDHLRVSLFDESATWERLASSRPVP